MQTDPDGAVALEATDIPLPPEPVTMGRRLRGIGMLMLVLVGGGLLVAGLEWLGGPEVLRETFGALSTLIVVPLQAVVAVSPFPSEVLAFAHCAVYGFWLGAVVAWAGWMVAAVLQYLLARRVADDFDFEHFQSRLPPRLRRLPVSHPIFLIGARYLPFGAHIVNSSAGAYHVPLFRHVWCSAISVAPQALVVSGISNGWVFLAG